MGPLPTEIGQRIYEIRRDLSPDPRHEMPQRTFAALLNRKAAELFADEKVRPRYDSSVVTRLEKGRRRVTVQDVTIVAAVDPEARGELWIGWGRLVRTIADAQREAIDAQAALDDAAVAERIARESPAHHPRKVRTARVK